MSSSCPFDSIVTVNATTATFGASIDCHVLPIWTLPFETKNTSFPILCSTSPKWIHKVLKVSFGCLFLVGMSPLENDVKLFKTNDNIMKSCQARCKDVHLSSRIFFRCSYIYDAIRGETWLREKSGGTRENLKLTLKNVELN